MTEKKENLDELLSRLYEKSEAADVASDIRIGEGILRRHPAPEPQEVLLAAIKSSVFIRCQHEHSQRPAFRSFAAAVAAAVIVITAIGFFFFNQPEQPAGFADSRFWDDTSAASAITSELDDIDNKISTIRLNRKSTDDNWSSFDEWNVQGFEIVADVGNF